MAIVKTVFTGATLAAQAPELLTYLQENAADYFDTISADGSGNISCMYDGVTALKIGMDGTSTRSVTLANGTTFEAASSGGARTALFKYAKKTNKGIMLLTNNATVSGTNTGAEVFVISKNDIGNTVVIVQLPTIASNSGKINYVFADISGDSDFYKPIANSAPSERANFSRTAPMTGRTPVVFNSAHYAPSLFVATFNQYSGIECDLNINGKSYASDGVMALED